MKKNPTENKSKRSVIISYGKNKRCLVSWDPDARERNLDPKIKVSCEPRLIDLISTYFPPPYNKKYLDIDLLFGTVRALLPKNPPGSAYYIEMCAVQEAARRFIWVFRGRVILGAKKPISGGVCPKKPWKNSSREGARSFLWIPELQMSPG